MVTIAYWDTEQSGTVPQLLGRIEGTPTIKLIKPKKKQAMGSVSDKVVVDYKYEREAASLLRFVNDQMPNFMERVTLGEEDFKKVHGKAKKFGLAQAVFFTKKSQPTALLKFLSGEFRRRLLLVHAPPTAKNQEALPNYGVNVGEVALIVVTPDGKQIQYTGGDFSRRKLESFLKEYATKEPVYKPAEVVATEEPERTATSTGSSDEEKATPKQSSSDKQEGAATSTDSSEEKEATLKEANNEETEGAAASSSEEEEATPKQKVHVEL